MRWFTYFNEINCEIELVWTGIVELPMKTVSVLFLVHDVDVNDCLVIKTWLIINLRVG